MSTFSIAEPDITLQLDGLGVIREMSVSDLLSARGARSWLGQPWLDTVGDASTDVVRSMIERARHTSVTGFREVVQRLPDGLELPIEYTTVSLGRKSGLLAVGRNGRAIIEVQSKLVETQRVMEQDYWKLREIETRYRLLFETANEAVLLTRGPSLRIAEANSAAIKALGMGNQASESVVGRELLSEIEPKDRRALQAMFADVAEQGRAPAILAHIAREGHSVLVRATRMNGGPDSAFMVQLTSIERVALTTPSHETGSTKTLIERAPDGFVIIAADGIVRFCNPAFLNIVGANMSADVVGRGIGTWLNSPGCDASVLMGLLTRHACVRLFSTTIQSQDGTSTSQVEISAAGDHDAAPSCYGLFLRDVSRRLAPQGDAAISSGLQATVDMMLGKATMHDIVREFVDEIEKKCIVGALARSGGSRTISANMLGLSRQSLHTKMGRHGLDGRAPSKAD